MDFFDNDNYENLLNLKQLNNKIQMVLTEIKEYEAKKKNNIYFLKIQKNTFQHIYDKKNVLLKKYYTKIIKNIIIIYYNEKSNKNCNNIIYTNNNNITQQQSIRILASNINSENIYNNISSNQKFSKLIKKQLHKSLEYFNSFLNNNNIEYKLLITENLSLNDIKLQNYNFYLYIFYYSLEPIYSSLNSYNIFQDIAKYHINLKFLHLELKRFHKLKQIEYKKICKLLSINIKLTKHIEKNKKQIDLLNKRTDDIKNKYICLYKYIENQEKKSSNTIFNFIKNIHELSIRIELCQNLLTSYKYEIEKVELILKEYDIIKGTKLQKSIQCMICLEDIEYGITTNCKHKFHYSCINLYVFNIIIGINNIEITCPLCRQFI